MAKKVGESKKVLLNSYTKGTSIGNGQTSMSTMNKHKKRGYNKYRGQGRV